MNFYKAVRPDCTDFTTGLTKLTLGEWMPDIRGRLAWCTNGYHVSDVITETLIARIGAATWPARLFEVEAPEVLSHQDMSPKHLCRTYRPVRELPAWQAFGPNGQEVVRFIESCEHITREQTNALALGKDTVWWAAKNASLLGREAAHAASRLAAHHTAGEAACAWGGNAAAYTAKALVVRDLITPAQFETITYPWVSVMGNTWEAGTTS
jgi:hypothetical protein